MITIFKRIKKELTCGVICLILVKYCVRCIRKGEGGDVLVNKGGGEGDKTICPSYKVSSLSVLKVLKP